MADKTIRVGVIGCGQIGTKHLERYQKIPGAKVVAVCDIIRERADQASKRFGAPYAFKKFRELLAMDEIDAVDVCVHNNLHAPITITSLAAGKHVYCEKPIAGSYADGKAMVDAARRHKRKLSIQLGTLFRMETHAAKRLIDEGHLGRLYYAKSYGFRRRGRPFVDGYGRKEFVQRKMAQGGALFDMGVYHIANILYLLGNPEVKTVSGGTAQEIDMYEDRRKEGPYQVEELGFGFCRLGGGVRMFIEESWAIHQESAPGSVVCGSKGGVRLDPFGYFTTLCDMPMNATLDLKGTHARWHSCGDSRDAYDSPQQHWIAALQGRVELIDTAGVALNTMKISNGIYLSQKLGREVTGAEIARLSKSTAKKRV